MIEICEKLKIRNPMTKLKEIGKLKDKKMSLGIKLWRNWDKRLKLAKNKKLEG